MVVLVPRKGATMEKLEIITSTGDIGLLQESYNTWRSQNPDITITSRRVTSTFMPHAGEAGLVYFSLFVFYRNRRRKRNTDAGNAQ